MLFNHIAVRYVQAISPLIRCFRAYCVIICGVTVREYIILETIRGKGSVNTARWADNVYLISWIWIRIMLRIV
jgi:hypothetical protein